VATTNDLKNGMALKPRRATLERCRVSACQAGQGPAPFVRTKLKNILSGKVVDRTFNAGVQGGRGQRGPARDAVPVPRKAGDFVFMDMTDYDQAAGYPRPWSATQRNYLLEEQTVTVAFNDGTPPVRRPAGRGRAHHQPDRPPACRATVSHRRHQAGHPREPAATIQVPLFISTRREDQGSTTRDRPVPRPRVMPPRSQQGAQAGPGTSSSRPSSAMYRSSTCSPSAFTLGSPPVAPLRPADLVRGVAVHAARIDGADLAVRRGLDHGPDAPRWTGNVLRIGVYELLWADDVPDAVAISEGRPAGPGICPTDASSSFVKRSAGPASPHSRPSLQP